MLTLTIVLLISTTVLGVVFFTLFCWAVKDGQFDDPEEAKYVIFRENQQYEKHAVNGGNGSWKKKKNKAGKTAANC